MKKQQNKSFIPFKKRDIILIFALLITAFSALAVMKNASGGVTATVIYDGNTIFQRELSEIKEKVVLSPAEGIEITAENGRIGFTSSTCETHECIKCGMLSEPCRTAACIPNKILITLTPNGKTRDGYDAIGY